MMIDFRFTVGVNGRGQWVARHDVTGAMALMDAEQGIVFKPGQTVTPELGEALTWVLGMTVACDHCITTEGCSPFKA